MPLISTAKQMKKNFEKVINPGGHFQLNSFSPTRQSVRTHMPWHTPLNFNEIESSINFMQCKYVDYMYYKCSYTSMYEVKAVR